MPTRLSMRRKSSDETDTSIGSLALSFSALSPILRGLDFLSEGEDTILVSRELIFVSLDTILVSWSPILRGLDPGLADFAGSNSEAAAGTERDFVLREDDLFCVMNDLRLELFDWL